MALKISEEYKGIVEQFVEKYPVNFGHIEMDKVLVMEEDEKTPKKYADVRKVGYPYNSLMEYKFIMTFYSKIIDGMTQAQKHLLVMHEMMHIDESFDKLRKHTIEDFVEIVAAYGPLWDTDQNISDVLEEDELPQNPDEN